MTNFSDPAVQLKDFGAYAFALGAGLWTLVRLMKLLTFLNSCSPELLAHNKWDLYVRVLSCVDLSLSCTSIRTSSWEYVTTLDFELDIIWGRRSYRWTIWVCSDRRFFACRYLSFEIRADSLARKIYSLARAALLISIILNIVGFSVTTPINCQVGSAFRL
jgi:hypothetical protein